MTKTKHTPGPWVVGRNLKYGQSILIDAENGDPSLHYSSWRGLAIVHGCDDSPIKGSQVAVANAHLIAAAPELLEALKAAVDCGMVPSSSSRTGGASRHSRQCVVADMIRDAITKAEGGE